MKAGKQENGAGRWLAALVALGLASGHLASAQALAGGAVPATVHPAADEAFVFSLTATNPPAAAAGPAGLTNAPQARLNEAKNDVQQGRVAQAIPTLERLVDETPQLTDAWETLGWAYWRLGREDEALALWGKLLKLNPQMPQAYNLLGAASVKRNDLTMAAMYYEKSLQIQPDQYDVELALARIARWTGDAERALEKLRALATKDPRRRDVKNELSRALGGANEEPANPLEPGAPGPSSATNEEHRARLAADVSSPRNALADQPPAPPLAVASEESGAQNVARYRPYVGALAEYFQDNLDSRNWRAYGRAGFQPTPRLTVEGRAGYGQMKQAFTNSSAVSVPDITLDEKVVNLVPSCTSPNGWTLLGELSARQFSGAVPGAQNFDKTVLQYALEGQAKPLLPLDMAARYEHDIVPAARAVVKETTYNMVLLSADWSLTDWWNLWASGQRYDFSDGNARNHLALSSSWLVWELIGLHLGLRYAYADASAANSDYWTPYQLHRYFVEADLRGTQLRIFYNLRLRYGLGRQGVRPEDQAALVLPGRNPPEEGWQPVVGASASARAKVGKHWELSGEVSHNKMPDYNETAVTAGLDYRF